MLDSVLNFYSKYPWVEVVMVVIQMLQQLVLEVLILEVEVEVPRVAQLMMVTLVVKVLY